MMIMRTALRMMIMRRDLSPWALQNDDHENCTDDDLERRFEALGLAE